MQRINLVERIDWNRDYELLKQTLQAGAGPDSLNERELEILRRGKETFLWESPLVPSAEKAASLARKAAIWMLPPLDRVILGAISSRIFRKDTSVIVRWDPRDREGIRFALAVSEGRAEEGRKRNALCVVGHPRLL